MAVATRQSVGVKSRPERPIVRATRNDSPGTLDEFLSTIARNFGENPALAVKPGFRAQLTTYAELDLLASRVGRLLQERGVRQGDRVLIWSPNMPAWVAAFFGCHRIGAVVVP